MRAAGSSRLGDSGRAPFVLKERYGRALPRRFL